MRTNINSITNSVVLGLSQVIIVAAGEWMRTHMDAPHFYQHGKRAFAAGYYAAARKRVVAAVSVVAARLAGSLAPLPIPVACCVPSGSGLMMSASMPSPLPLV